MEIRHSTLLDLPELLKLYEVARNFMKEQGNPHQWGDTGWPNEKYLKKDIMNGVHYVVLSNDEIVGAFSFSIGADPTYLIIEDGNWLNDEPYGVIHKAASNQKCHGVMDAVYNYCSRQINNIRIDTHKDNKPMLNWIKKKGFTWCGHIYTGDGTIREAFQKIIKE